MSAVVYRQVVIIDLDGVRFRFHPYQLLYGGVSPELREWFGLYGTFRYVWGYPRYVR